MTPAGTSLLIAGALVAAVVVAERPAGEPASLAIDYPAENTIFPPEVSAPAFQWRDADRDARSWRIEVNFADGSGIHADTPGPPESVGDVDPRCSAETNEPPILTPEQAAAHTWRPDADTWAEIKRRSCGRPATVTVRSPGGAKASVAIETSKDPAGAPVFYRDVPLMPSATEKGIIKPLAPNAVPLIAWRLRNLAETSSRVVLEGMHTCANCHSFSADGKTLGMDLDGPQNDKGLYAIVPLRPRTTLRNEDVVAWTSFRDKVEGDLRVGLLSRISPDGRYVVTTIKPPGADREQLYYVVNFKSYRFLQVFYPTRGILVWYDRKTGRLEPLPGADDLRYVQANAVWSPDGRYLVFARAAARNACPAGAPPALFAGDPNETPIQYDLYRIPFNGGRGGRAEPIAGASTNGMSNSFPRISPDGRWIVFVQARNGLLMRPDSRLYIVPAVGGRARRMNANTPLMNSWHSFSPNGRWLVFSSKSRSPYTQMYLTHIDEEGNDSPPVLVENATAANRAVNLPEFVSIPPDGLIRIDAPAAEYYRLFDSATDLARKRQYPESLAEWAKAMALNPDDARGNNNFGFALAEAGKLDEAIGRYRRALQANPDYADAHDNLGVALARKGQAREAMREYEAALALNPEFPQAHNNLGIALASEGKWDGAIGHYRRALDAAPDFAEAHGNLAIALAEQGRIDEAIPHFEQVVARNPRLVEAHYNLGNAFSARGRLGEALAHWRSVLEAEPERLTVLNQAAWVLATTPQASLRNGPEAVQLAARAVQLTGGKDTGSLATLAAAYAETGQFAMAIETARRARELAAGQSNRQLTGTLDAMLGLYERRTALRARPLAPPAPFAPARY